MVHDRVFVRFRPWCDWSKRDWSKFRGLDSVGPVDGPLCKSRFDIPDADANGRQTDPDSDCGIRVVVSIGERIPERDGPWAVGESERAGVVGPTECFDWIGGICLGLVDQSSIG